MLACKEENFQNREGRDLIVLTVCYYMNITTEESIVLTSFFVSAEMFVFCCCCCCCCHLKRKSLSHEFHSIARRIMISKISSELKSLCRLKTLFLTGNSGKVAECEKVKTY